MKKTIATILALAILIPSALYAAPISWDFTSGVLKPLQSAVNARIMGSSFHATSTATSSTFTILNDTWYADYLPDSYSDIGAKVMAAYAAMPDAGGKIVITASSTFSNPMLFTTPNKHVLLECDPGVVLNYTGTGSSTVFATFVYPDYPSDAGINGCTFDGPSGSTVVGVSLGNSSGGAAGYNFRNFVVKDFGYGVVSGANTYLTSFDNFKLENNNKALVVYEPNNSGENLRFSNGLIGDCKTIADCVYFATSSSASTLWEGMSLDNAQLKIATGNFNFNIVGGHCENPAAQSQVIGKYACIVNNGETTGINGLSVVNMATSSAQTPDAFIINTGYLNIFSASVWAANSISAPAFVSNSSAATANIYGFNELGTSIDTLATSSVGFYIADNRNVGIGTSSPAGLLDVNGSAFFGNQTGTAQLTLRGGSGRNATIGQEGTSATSAVAINSNGAIDFRTDGTSKMYITDLGLVGIGTLFPNTLLQVVGTSTFATTTITDLWVSRGLRDTFNLTGTSGQVLQTTGTSTRWVSTSSLGISASGATTWGSITGTLSAQTDLQTALDGKVNDTGDTITGALTVQGTTTFATTTTNRLTIGSATGLLKSTSGLVSTAIAGTDYLDTIATTTVRGMISSTAVGLDYTVGTGIFSLASGYVISSTTREINQDTAFSWGNHASAGYLTAIPTTTVRGMVTSSAAGLTYTPGTGDFSLTSGSVIPTTTRATNWDTAFSWGNHASAGYLTSYTETDPIFSASAAFGINSTLIGNWSTAHSWGNHASSGYAVGPASATDNAIARFDLTTGKLIQNSSATVSDTGSITAGNATGNQSIAINSGSTRIGSITQIGTAANSALQITSNGALDLQVDGINRISLGEFGDITFGATSTLATTTISRLTVGTLNGLLAGNNGLVSALATSSLNIDLANTVGTLGATRGGTGLTSYATGDLIYASGANTLANRTIGSTGNVLSVVGGVPTWVSTSSLNIAGGGGFADPLTTNGDIIARISGATTRLAQGANGTFLGVSGGVLGYYTPAGSGTINSGTTGQLARYNAAGTTISGTSTITVADNGTVFMGSPSISPNIAAVIEEDVPAGYSTVAVRNTAADGRAQLTFSNGLGSNYYDCFIGSSGSSTLNYPNTMEVGCGFAGSGINLWTDGFLQARMATSGNMGFGTTTNLTKKLALQATVVGQDYFDVASTSGRSVWSILASGATRLLAITEPAAPSAENLIAYVKNIAGRLHFFTKNPSGQSMPVQDAMWNSAVIQWRPTTVTAGLWVQTVGAGAGTFANVLPSNSTVYTQQKRARYSNVVTTANQVLGQRNTEALWWRGDSAGEGGFFNCSDFGFNTWTNGGRMFFGLHSGTTVVSADPSALNNTVGFAVDAADNGAISFLTRGTSATKASTGLTITSGKGYKACFYAAPNSSEIGWWIKDINTGTEASSTATANLPTNTTFLTLGTLASNAALTTVDAIQLEVANIYSQKDY